jgi:hypothetical protein
MTAAGNARFAWRPNRMREAFVVRHGAARHSGRLWRWAAQSITEVGSEWATTPPLDATVTTSAPIATFDVVKLFHRTLADAREMTAQTFLVAVDQSRE